MSAAEAPSRARLLTIGAVCARLKDEFPDISISKIRYLEDQGLLAPRRTQGGYRLFTEDDVERLETILRLQRDEFLPLRVIRQELASPAATERKRRRPTGLNADVEDIDLAELCERAAVAPELVKELEDFGLLEPRTEAGRSSSPTTTSRSRSPAASSHASGSRRGTCARSAPPPTAKPVCSSRSSRRPSGSRNPERRQSGLEDLQALAELTQGLAQRLFWRHLRSLVQ